MSSTICFVGDINFGRGISDLNDAALANLLDDSIVDCLFGDLVTGNLECVLGDVDVANPLSHSNFKTPFRNGVDTILKKFHVLSFANNHLYDFCDAGVASTLAHCNQLGVIVVGVGDTIERAYEPALLQLADGKIAVFGCTTVSTLAKTSVYHAAEPDEKMCQNIRNVSAKGYTVIVHCHAGGGDFEYPAPYIRQLHSKLTEAGAKLVIGHHPHLVQGWFTGRVSSFFSMGDFIFDKFEDSRDISILVRASFIDGELRDYHVHPVKRSPLGYRLRLIDGEELLAFYQHADVLNRNLLSGNSDKKYIQWYGNPIKRQIQNLLVEFKKTGFLGVYCKLKGLNLRKLKSVLEVITR